MNKPTLSADATTGSYSNLTDKPYLTICATNNMANQNISTCNGVVGRWWSSTEYSATYASIWDMNYLPSSVGRDYNYKQ